LNFIFANHRLFVGILQSDVVLLRKMSKKLRSATKLSAEKRGQSVEKLYRLRLILKQSPPEFIFADIGRECCFIA
jgi:hypothetical protein